MTLAILRLAPRVFVAADRLVDGRPDGVPSPDEERRAARSTLRRLLAEAAGESAAAEPLAARPGGQPYLPGRPDLTVSLSHSRGWVAAAVHTGGGQVGLDVQAAVAPSQRLIGRCCSPTGRAVLAALPEPERAEEFAWIWSVQEACVKATGRGIGGLPWTVPVEVGQTIGRWRDLDWHGLRDWLPVAISCAHDCREWTEASA